MTLTRVLKTKKKGQKVVTYDLKGDDRFTIDHNKGKITVPSGLEKGDYSMTLIVHADGGPNYKKTDPDPEIPVTIKVK